MIPIPDTIPVNWWWFEILLTVTFFIHLLLMNSLLGSSLIGVVTHFKSAKPAPESASIPTLVALTVNFGVPPLLFLQVLYGQFFYSSSILIGIPWLLVIPLLIAAYYAAYLFVYKREVSRTFAGVSLVVSALLLLYIGFMMTSNNTLMLTPGKWGLYFQRPDGAGFNPGESTLIPRYLHFVIASLAVGGAWKALYHRFSRKGRPDQIKIGLKIVAGATLLQFLDGFWFLLALPSEILASYLGQSLPATSLLVAALGLTVVVIVAAHKGKLIPTIASLAVLVLLMIINRDLLRHFYLEQHFSPSQLVVVGEYSPLILFLIVFAVGLAVLAYMIHLLVKSK